ncbi:putative ribosomal P protein AGP2beta-1 [Leishmania mexicana MHOM/GT/2001/U1103]|uniref:Ribosomal P protein AGP2beta-1 n=1 Tax=Leishmania mexicana (strain MHOM/GT/2001/U1103) TaxID=929439 RepID=E9B1E8_LEIMU|nr:putative ribosomal P protein AGP2beta-1 [Leishmania mexicana MHOM/GT/2001/U1103]CBZ29054.1 putative ribosomal P protein AGP2beta-1 [Leishmania mexicana MHOM/GT/2001/U1103]
MTLQENRDSYKVKGLSLSQFVLQCSDCHQLCLEKTARIVENRSRAPRGWEALFNSVAEERRSEDLDLCESRCRYMQATCPSQDKVQQYEQALAAASLKPKKSTPLNTSVLQEASRCEHAVEVFSNVLFALAHKPSKVSFPTKDLKTGGTTDAEAHGGAPTEAHRKVLEGAKSTDTDISRRWRKLRQERLDSKVHDLAASTGSSSVPDTAATSPGSSGTTPKW